MQVKNELQLWAKLYKSGFCLKKASKPKAEGFLILDTRTNKIVAGRNFTLNFSQAEQFADEQE